MTNTNTQNELKHRITELEAEISILKQQKKYGLVWEDKPEDVVTSCVTSVPVLSEVISKKVSDNLPSENIIIEGDNYHALSVLNYTHRKKIDLY
jgi:adenine-specific DNA-methyltransferase